jgi:hypothetical protein
MRSMAGVEVLDDGWRLVPKRKRRYAVSQGVSQAPLNPKSEGGAAPLSGRLFDLADQA